MELNLLLRAMAKVEVKIKALIQALMAVKSFRDKIITKALMPQKQFNLRNSLRGMKITKKKALRMRR